MFEAWSTEDYYISEAIYRPGNIEYLYIAITLRSTLNWFGNTCQDSILC